MPLTWSETDCGRFARAITPDYRIAMRWREDSRAKWNRETFEDLDDACEREYWLKQNCQVDVSWRELAEIVAMSAATGE